MFSVIRKPLRRWSVPVLLLLVTVIFAGVPAAGKDSEAVSSGKRSGITIAQYAARRSNFRAPQPLEPDLKSSISTGSVPVSSESKDVNLVFTAAGVPKLAQLPKFTAIEGNRYYSVDQSGNRIYYTVQPGLQQRAESILDLHRVSWGSLVALDPRNGKVLAIASRSTSNSIDRPTALRATFPAASLFKVITGSAAVETAGMNGGDLVYFRGGNHTLERYNYLPNIKTDRRVMSLEEAMGKSVNAVFARIALQKLSRGTIKHYAEKFGFNSTLQFDVPVEPSSFQIAFDDYSIARTAAGFGDAYLSPLHAASWMGALSQQGRQMRPVLIDEVRSPTGKSLYQARSVFIDQIVSSETSTELMAMMRSTTETGTARRFFHGAGSLFNTLPVSGKTGTLSGQDPKGMYFWFVGAVPTHAPEIAVAALVIDTDHRIRIRASHAARHLLEYYFRSKFGMAAPALVVHEMPRKVYKKKRVAKVYKQKKRVSKVVKRPKAQKFVPPKAKVTAKKKVVKSKKKR